ncbi:MAG: hypothetical protein IKT40_09130 [Bacilli bacterium]|nr:hypothetical protein [Bacilli bacterium]
MSFEFVEQAPADTLRLFDFVKTNRNNIELEEQVKISFVESDSIPRAIKPTVLLNVVFQFNNSELKYPYMITSICGDYVCSDKIKFSNNRLESYLFLRSILVKDNIMYPDNYCAIVSSIPDVMQYLENKELIIDGQALKEYKLEVIDIV